MTELAIKELQGLFKCMENKEGNVITNYFHIKDEVLKQNRGLVRQRNMKTVSVALPAACDCHFVSTFFTGHSCLQICTKPGAIK